MISHRLLIDENYAAPLRDWLGAFRGGSMLILDEAHHAAPASGQKYAIDSKITRAVEDSAKRFKHRLFLSATPHNGHSNSFSRLLELLDPQRFCRVVPAGSMIFQPSDERRRSGSHYTPRSLTEPIVRTTLQPILDQLITHPDDLAVPIDPGSPRLASPRFGERGWG